MVLCLFVTLCAFVRKEGTVIDGVSFRDNQGTASNYTDDSEHPGHTFYNKMSSEDRSYVTCPLEMFGKDNGLNSLYEFDLDTLECLCNTVIISKDV